MNDDVEEQSVKRVQEDDFDPAKVWHLVQSETEEVLTSFEFVLMQVDEAYQRWAVQVARLVGNEDISFNEVVALNVVRMQERPKDAAAIAKLVNRDDLPNIQYNLRKLVSLGLLERVRAGSATLFQVTERGSTLTDRYGELRRGILAEGVMGIANVNQEFKRAIRFLQLMTGVYDGGVRASAAINPTFYFTPQDGDTTKDR